MEKEVHDMALGKYSHEQVQKMSMIEVANIILTEQKKELNFIDLFNLVAEHKQFTEAQKDDLLARFYTDLNVDGRFATIGSNVWGLKRWYPVDQTSEKVLTEARKRQMEDEEDYDEDLLEGFDEDEENDEDEVTYDEYDFSSDEDED